MIKRVSSRSLRIFLIRVLLGLVLGFALIRVFLPQAGMGTVLSAGALLVFFAYLLEALRQR